MALVHLCPKLVVQDLPQIQLLAPDFLLHSLNRVVTEVIQAIFSKDMGYMVIKLEVNTVVVLAELLAIKLLAKGVTKPVKVTKAIKASVVVVTMVGANSSNNSSAVDGVVTTDINLAQEVAHVLG